MAKNKVVHKTRRSNGEGSIYKRKDGRWAGYVSIGVGDDGRTKRKLVYGRSQAEVAKKLYDISGRLKTNSYDLIEKSTFSELMRDWLWVFKKNTVISRTFDGLFWNFRKHIEPHIGNMKIYEIDTYVVQKVLNILIDKNYSLNVVKKNKHMISQFFEYAIDNGWATVNPTTKIKLRGYKKIYNGADKYKALTPEERIVFLEALAKDEGNLIKPLCLTLMFAGLRIGEALALKWSNIDFENKTLKVERSITMDSKIDSYGHLISRVTVVGATKTLCSVREIPIVDIVVDALKEWHNKQVLRQNSDKNITGDISGKSAFIFANDDGSVRTYSGTRKIFDNYIRRNKLQKLGIHFHGFRHTFSNMLFEMNENPKVIQQLLGHRDVKTTITVYNSVDNEYIRATTEKFNEKLKEDQMILQRKQREEIIEDRKEKLTSDMNDDEFDDMLAQLLEERKARKARQKDFEM